MGNFSSVIVLLKQIERIFGNPIAFHTPSPPVVIEQLLYFGLQRVAGVNLVAIQRLSTEENLLPENFEDVKSVVNKLTDQTYEEALEEGRLYITNYQMLQMMSENLKEVDGIPTQYTTDPVALYYRQENWDGLLRPLAIQLSVTQPTSLTNPIYTPADGQHWLMAKNYVQTADAVVFTTWTHGARNHYLIESIILASYRNFAKNHPLLALLYPQFRGTLVHYGQYQYLAYVPNMPLSLYAPPSKDFEGFMFKRDLMKLLPTFWHTIIQSFAFYINNVKVERIGQYNLSMFDSRSSQLPSLLARA
ncbi:MAG: lipoxygenase family protein [Xenococcaceae cyanobacterium MO_234.B1]|nr:lipoxygenase family protein [Xenococcaceae cyanobacterium MO_234.B1]